MKNENTYGSENVKKKIIKTDSIDEKWKKIHMRTPQKIF